MVDSGRRVVAFAIILGSSRVLAPYKHGHENWAGAMQKVRSVANGENMPVVLPSGFVEASDPKVLDDPNPEPARCTFRAAANVSSRWKACAAVPYQLDEKSAQYVERVLADFKKERQFVLVVRFSGFSVRTVASRPPCA